MSNYYKQVIKPILQSEKKYPVTTKEERRLFQHAARLLRREERLLSNKARINLQRLLDAREQLRLVYSYKQSLQSVWLKTASSQKELIEALQVWCRQAEESGLEVLKEFSQQLKGYVPVYVV